MDRWFRMEGLVVAGMWVVDLGLSRVGMQPLYVTGMEPPGRSNPENQNRDYQSKELSHRFFTLQPSLAFIKTDLDRPLTYFRAFSTRDFSSTA